MWEFHKTSTDNHHWTPGSLGAGYLYARSNTPDSMNLLDYSMRTWNIGPDDTQDIHRTWQREDYSTPILFEFYISPTGGIHDGGKGFKNRTGRPNNAVIEVLHRKDNRLYNGHDEIKVNRLSAANSEVARELWRLMGYDQRPRLEYQDLVSQPDADFDAIQKQWIEDGKGQEGDMFGDISSGRSEKAKRFIQQNIDEIMQDPQAVNSAWLLVQHMDFDPEFQKWFLGYLNPYEHYDEYRYLADRLKIGEGQEQIFNTQTGAPELMADYGYAPEQSMPSASSYFAKRAWDMTPLSAVEELKLHLAGIEPKVSHTLSWVKGGKGRGLMRFDGSLITWPVNKKGEPQHADMYEYLTGETLPETHSVQDFILGVPFDIYEDGTLAFFGDVAPEMLADINKIDYRLKTSKVATKSVDKFTEEDAIELMQKHKFDFDANEFAMGMNDELEHVDVTHGDPDTTAKIVADHLREHPDYYTQLRTKISHSYQGFDFHFNTRTGEPCTCGYAPVGGKKLARRTASQAVRKIKNQDQKHLRSDEGQEILDFLHRMISGHSIEDKGEFGQGRLPGIEGLVPWIVKQIKDGYIIPVHKSDLENLSPIFFRDPINGRAPDDIQGDPIVDMAYFWGETPEQTPWDFKTKIAKWNKAKNVFLYDPADKDTKWFRPEFRDKLVDHMDSNVGIAVAILNTVEELNKFIGAMSNYKDVPVFAIVSRDMTAGDPNSIYTEVVGSKLAQAGLNVKWVQGGTGWGHIEEIKNYLFDQTQVSNKEIAETEIPVNKEVYHTITWDAWQKWFNATGAPAREGKNVMEMTPYQVRSAAMEHQVYLDNLERMERWREYFGGIKDRTKVYDIKNPEFAGWTVNKIEDAEVAEAAGDVLGHCIGSDEQPYKDSIDRGETEAYMLCDPDGLPHASWHYDPHSGYLAHVEGKSGNLSGTETEEKYRALVTEFNLATDHDDYEGEQGNGWIPDPPYDAYVTLPDPTTVSDFEWQLVDIWDAAYHYQDYEDWVLGENTELEMGDPRWDEICDDFARNISDDDAVSFIANLIDHSWIGNFVSAMKENGYLEPEVIEQEQENVEEYGYASPTLVLVNYLKKHNFNVEDIKGPGSLPDSFDSRGFTQEEYEAMKAKEPHYDWPEWEDLTGIMGTNNPARAERERAEARGEEYRPSQWTRQYLLPHVDPRLLDHEVQHNPDAPIPPHDVGSMAFRNVAAVHERGHNGDIGFLHFNPHTGAPCYCVYGPSKAKQKNLTRTASDAVRKVKNQKQKIFQSDEGMAALDALNRLISGVSLSENDQGKVGDFPGLEKLVPWFVKQIKDETVKYIPGYSASYGFGFLRGTDEDVKSLKESFAKTQSVKIGYFAPGSLERNSRKTWATIESTTNMVSDGADALKNQRGFNVTTVDLTEGENPQWIEVETDESEPTSVPYTVVEGSEPKDLDSFDIILFAPAVLQNPNGFKTGPVPFLSDVVEQTRQLREIVGPDVEIILDTNAPAQDVGTADILRYDAPYLEKLFPVSELPTEDEVRESAMNAYGYDDDDVVLRRVRSQLLFQKAKPLMEQLGELASTRVSASGTTAGRTNLARLITDKIEEADKPPLRLSEVELPETVYTIFGRHALSNMSDWINATNAPARKKITASALKGAVNRAIKKLAYLQKMHEETGRGVPVDTEPTWDNEDFIRYVNEELNLTEFNDPRKDVFYEAMKAATDKVLPLIGEPGRERNNAILEVMADIALPQFEVNVMDMRPDDVMKYGDAHQRYVEHMQKMEELKEYYEEEEDPDIVHRFQGPYEGWTVVELDDEDDEQLARESQTLGHCIGESDSPNYREAILNGVIKAYSLRDPDNIPKVTWHFNPDGTLGHMQGKAGATLKAIGQYRPLISEFNTVMGLDDDNGGVGVEQPLDEYGEPEDQVETISEVHLWDQSSMYAVIEQWDDPYSAAAEQVAEMEGQDGQEYRLDDDATVHRGDYEWFDIAMDFFEEGGPNRNYMRQRLFEIVHEDGYTAELMEALDNHIEQYGPEAWKEVLQGRERPKPEDSNQIQIELMQECSDCKGTGIGPNDEFGAETECKTCKGTGETKVQKQPHGIPGAWSYITDENNEIYQMYKAFRAIHTNPSSGAFEEPEYITREQYDKIRDSLTVQNNPFADYMPEWEQLYRKFGPDFEDRPLPRAESFDTWNRAYLPASQDPRMHQINPVRERVESCIKCKATGEIEEKGEDGIVRTKLCDVCNGKGHLLVKQDVTFGPSNQTVYEHDDSDWGADVEGLGQIPGQTYMAKLTAAERAAAWDTPFDKLSAAQKAHVSGLEVIDPEQVWDFS